MEQDLQMFREGVRNRELTRRLRKYEKYMTDPVLQDRAAVLKYKDLVLEALSSAPGLATYLPGEDIPGEALRVFSAAPRFSGPMVCQV